MSVDKNNSQTEVEVSTKDKNKSKIIADTQDIIRGLDKEPADCLELAKKLIDKDEHGWARRLLDKVVERDIDDVKIKKIITQKRAFATYKDSHLNRDVALDRALKILEQEYDLKLTDDPETLGLTGAIYKRKWEVDGQKEHLERSLNYYRRRYDSGYIDDGYTAINAAYIQDILAFIEEKQSEETGSSSLTSEQRRVDATEMREKIVESLSHELGLMKNNGFVSNDYWNVVTLAEGYFGLSEYGEAKKWLLVAGKIKNVPIREYLSTAKQLAHLAQVQADYESPGTELEQTEAWKTLSEFLGPNKKALRSIFIGKVGLALSGGGFRASLYHIGVLAKLAELDLLRHIEVLSCVSGGSIIGAHYYLELRRLMMKDQRADSSISRADYIEIMQRITDDFLKGVQENPRVRILANPFVNLKMIFSSYSRTQKLGELYEKLIYSRIKDGEEDKDRWINKLFIYPADELEGFKPRRDNWSRECKVPELILNATTLNTGHNWQFTSSWMGESPTNINRKIDSNNRYRRMYYDEAPEPYKNIRLGYAVGASSCVPGLFEPLIFKGLYPNNTVRLVDGGVYDNQGIASLLEQDCSVILLSDATGQLNTEDDSGGGVMKPLLRMSSILMHRVRGAQYEDLNARKRTSLIKAFAYVHLNLDLDGKEIDWVDCEEPSQGTLERNNIVTSYGIRKNIQKLLAGMRTDLDSFSDIEAYALMTSGYEAVGQAVRNLKVFQITEEPMPEWKFLKVRPAMKQIQGNEVEYEKLVKHLEVSPVKFFKVWKLYRPLKVIAMILGVMLLCGICYAWYSCPECKPVQFLLDFLSRILTLKIIMTSVLIIIISNILTDIIGSRSSHLVMQLSKIKDIFQRVGVAIGLVIVGWIVALIHLKIFDRLFKHIGRIE